MRFGVLLFLAATLTGCSVPSTVTDTFEIEPDQYEVAFDAARNVLRNYRFRPDRVDARAGVIATDSKASAGLATPWDIEQSTFEDEFSDLGNDQRRRIRVTFTPVDDDAEEGLGAAVPDVRTATGPIEVQVQAYVERVRTPGLRLEATKINVSSRTSDPTLIPRGMQPRYVQTIHRDDKLARRIAYAISRKLDRAER